MTTVLRGCVGAITSATIIRALQHHGVRVVGMDSDPRSVGEHLCDAFYVVPEPTAPWFVVPEPSGPGYIDCILDICQKEKVDAILPSAEEEILMLLPHRALFAERGIQLLCPGRGPSMVCANKSQTYQYFYQQCIPTPMRYDRNFQEDVKFPCIVKPRMGRGGKGVVKVEDPIELDWRLSRNPELIIQEYIDGPLWAVDVLADWDSSILSLVSREKYLMQAGSMTKGITRRDDQAMAYVRQMVDDLKLVGPVIIEYLRDSSDPKFIDINTRFGGGGAALATAADPTIIPNLVRMIHGETTVPSTGFTEGLEMLTYYSEIFTRKG